MDVLTLAMAKGASTSVPGEKGDTGNGIKSTIMNDDYTLTIEFTDGTSYTTPSIRGEKGATGSQGAKGEKGDKGEQGIQGLPGEKGEKGDTGAAGKDGANGTNGTNGKDGADGASITAISFTKDANGEIVGGIATLSINTEIDIAITSVEATE